MGSWINGGGLAANRGPTCHWLYRDYHLVRQVIEECRAGNPRVFYQVGHPHAFWTAIYMGEVHLCKPQADPSGALAGLKALTLPYPPRPENRHDPAQSDGKPEFSLDTSRKSASRGDVLHVPAGCFAARPVWCR